MFIFFDPFISGSGMSYLFYFVESLGNCNLTSCYTYTITCTKRWRTLYLRILVGRALSVSEQGTDWRVGLEVDVEGSGRSHSGAFPFPTLLFYNITAPALILTPLLLVHYQKRKEKQLCIIKNLKGNGRAGSTETRGKLQCRRW